jgi:hypothetical protein
VSSVIIVRIAAVLYKYVDPIHLDTGIAGVFTTNRLQLERVRDAASHLMRTEFEAAADCYRGGP